MLRQRPLLIAAAGSLGVAVLLAGGHFARGTGPAAADAAAVARARKTVLMLDDIYKTTVVLITDKYVHSEDDFPAGGAAVALFDAIRKKGWHDVRLVDATGQPYSEKNVAHDAFEKDAIKKLKQGESFVERVEQIGDVNYYRAATPIPVVMEKCTMCHPHYKDAKKGEPIGALTYKLKIE